MLQEKNTIAIAYNTPWLLTALCYMTKSFDEVLADTAPILRFYCTGKCVFSTHPFES